jgi:hypothetical protein
MSASVLAAVMAGGCGSGASVARLVSGRPESIAFDASSCAPGWSAQVPGHYAFSVRNRSGHPASVSLMEFGSGVVVARLADAGPGSVQVHTNWAGRARRGWPRTSAG